MKTLTLSIACLLAIATMLVMGAPARAADTTLGVIGYRQVCDGRGHCHAEPIYGVMTAQAAPAAVQTADFKRMPIADGPTVAKAPLPAAVQTAEHRFAARHPAAAEAVHHTREAAKTVLTLPLKAVRRVRHAVGGDCGCHGQCGGAGCRCRR